MKILVVEDEPKLRSGIAFALQQRGFVIDTAGDGEEGEYLAKVHPYDCLVLDVMMPKRDGITVCRNLRAAGKTTPILLLTARDTVEDKVQGLDSGADDYLAKPFAVDELAARIRALLRRPATLTNEQLTLDDLVLDVSGQRVAVAGKTIELTLREFGLLEYLLRNKGKVVTREEVMEHVWDRFFDSLSNVVDVHLKNLRKKLPARYAKRIATIRGKGYRIA